MVVVANILMLRWKWVRLSMILGWDGKDPQTSGTLYKMIIQAILLFEPETCVMALRISRTIVRPHHRVALCSTGIHMKRGT